MATDNIQSIVDSAMAKFDEAPETIEEVVEEEVVEEENADVADPETSEDEADEDEADPALPSTFTVKVDGTEREVSLDDLKRSYSGNAYVQKGMQEAAAAQKQAAAINEFLQAEQARFLDVVTQFQQQGFKQQPREPDMAMLESDPIGYMQAEARYRKESTDYANQQGQLQTMQNQMSLRKDQEMQEYVQGQVAVLQSKIPEFADAKTAGELRARLMKTGAEAYGFSEAELGSIVDARQVLALYDAAQWRQLQASKATAVKKPAEATRTVKPAARGSEPTQLAYKRLSDKARSTGKISDFVEAAMNRR